jgi:hypothetical protein
VRDAPDAESLIVYTGDVMNKPPIWFWIAAVAALFWAIAGCASYLVQVSLTEADLAQLPDAQADMYRMLPAWLDAVFAVAVWSGLAGAIALLLRRRIARTFYIVSLAAVILQFGYVFGATPILTTIGPSSAAFPAFVIVAGVVLVWFAGLARGRGWLR